MAYSPPMSWREIGTGSVAVFTHMSPAVPTHSSTPPQVPSWTGRERKACGDTQPKTWW